MAKTVNFYRPLLNATNKQTKEMLNDLTFIDLYDRLRELKCNTIQWHNLPDSIEERFIEITLFERGYGALFKDPVLGEVFTAITLRGDFDIYRTPKERQAFAVNGYNKAIDYKNSVIVWNNYLRQSSSLTIQLFASRLAEIERTCDVNILAQKTPFMINCDEKLKDTIVTAYKEVRENSPVIVVDKNFDARKLDVHATTAPYLADVLKMTYKIIWNEAMTFCGIETVQTEKKERNIGIEVEAGLGAVKTQRDIFLTARNQSNDLWNKMSGREGDNRIFCTFRQAAEEKQDKEDNEVDNG